MLLTFYLRRQSKQGTRLEAATAACKLNSHRKMISMLMDEIDTY
jgi:hypothetical protein